MPMTCACPLLDAISVIVTLLLLRYSKQARYQPGGGHAIGSGGGYGSGYGASGGNVPSYNAPSAAAPYEGGGLLSKPAGSGGYGGSSGYGSSALSAKPSGGNAFSSAGPLGGASRFGRLAQFGMNAGGSSEPSSQPSSAVTGFGRHKF